MSTPIYTGTSANVLNAIRNQASAYYREYVPIATENDGSLMNIGNVIMDNVDVRNEFIDTLVNRIGLQLVTSKSWKSIFSRYVKGKMSWGQVVNEIYPELASVFAYDVSAPDYTFLREENPDVKSAYHYINTKRFYKVSIRYESMQSGFLGESRFIKFVTDLCLQLFEGEEYDDYQIVKYMIAREITRKRLPIVTIPAGSGAKEIVKQFRAISNLFTFRKRDFNLAGVRNFAPKESQDILIDARMDAEIDVDVYSEAFHMEKAEMYARKTLIDDFTTFDYERLQTILVNDTDYHEFTEDELNYLKKVKSVVFDRDFLMIFDNIRTTEEFRNGEKLSKTYWYHVWKSYSISPFANCVVIAEEDESVVNSVNFVNKETSYKTGVGYQLEAHATGTGVINEQVVFSFDASEDHALDTLTPNGYLIISKDSPSATSKSAKIVITSVAKPSVKTTVTLTIS